MEQILTKEQTGIKIQNQSTFLMIFLSVMGVIMLLYSATAMYAAVDMKAKTDPDAQITTTFVQNIGTETSTESHTYALSASLTNMYEKFFSGIFSSAVLFAAVSLFAVIKKTGTPFTRRVIIRLYLISGLLLAGALMSPVLAIILCHLTEGVVYAKIVFSSMGFGVVLAVVVFALIRIFSYGTVLQQESDETL